MDRPLPEGLRARLEFLQECAREAAAAVSEEQLSRRVMELFRAENLKGLSELMAERKLALEFRDDLSAFVRRWAGRLSEPPHYSDRQV